ncbi:MAG TPA: DUF916 domain-containing protein [Ktedonobacteraceae bacterium]|jgi:hypothetical protein
MRISADFLSRFPGRLLRLSCGLVLAVLVLLACHTASNVSASGGNAHFSIEPTFAPPYNVRPRPYFIYNSVPGARLVDHLHIVNDGSARGTLHLYAADATTAPTSGTTFLSENASSHDVGSWITLSKQQITLNPGQSREVPFTLTVPGKVLPGQHGGGILGVQLLPPQTVATTTANSFVIKVQSTLALGVLVNLPGARAEKLTTRSITYDTASEYQRLLLALENNGTQLLYPAGTLQVFDGQHNLLQNLKIHMSTFLPRTSINYPVDIQQTPLLPGHSYTVKLALKYGHNHHLAYDSTLLVPIPDKGPLEKFFQHLGSPVANPVGNFFSQITPLDCAITLGIVFLILSSLFFCSQPLSRIFRQLWRRLF